jgi:hypothetical protein
VLLSQTIALGDTPFDPNDPLNYQIGLRYRHANIISQATVPRIGLLVHEAGATLIDYGLRTLARVATGDTDWTAATVPFPLDPLLQTGASYDRIDLVFDTAATFGGGLSVDTLSVQDVGQGVELAINGCFTQGRHEVATGDRAATVLVTITRQRLKLSRPLRRRPRPCRPLRHRLTPSCPIR